MQQALGLSWLVTIVVVMLVLGLQGAAMAGTANLLQALDEGTVVAEFRGTGDLGVDAMIERQPGGPNHVTISPGTQFWAQMPGRQGMTTLGWVPVDLSRRSVAYLRIPTACTNINLRAPDPEDVMFPYPAPDVRLARLTGYVDSELDDINVVQVAVWAVANNAPRHAVLRQADYMLDPDLTDEQARRETFDAIMSAAAGLVQRAGLDPNAYRTFR